MNSSPGERNMQYDRLYHNFAVSYANIQQLTTQFYPLTKRFIQGIEPEINDCMKKLSVEEGATNSFSPITLIDYMSHFDDFIIRANSLFSDLKKTLIKSEDFMNRVLEIKVKDEAGGNSFHNFQNELTPELAELVDGLTAITERVGQLNKQMKVLRLDWEKTREKVS